MVVEAEHCEHRMRPKDAAAGRIPVPQAAAAAVERGADAAAHGVVDEAPLRGRGSTASRRRSRGSERRSRWWRKASPTAQRRRCHNESTFSWMTMTWPGRDLITCCTAAVRRCRDSASAAIVGAAVRIGRHSAASMRRFVTRRRPISTSRQRDRMAPPRSSAPSMAALASARASRLTGGRTRSVCGASSILRKFSTPRGGAAGAYWQQREARFLRSWGTGADGRNRREGAAFSLPLGTRTSVDLKADERDGRIEADRGRRRPPCMFGSIRS